MGLEVFLVLAAVALISSDVKERFRRKKYKAIEKDSMKMKDVLSSFVNDDEQVSYQHSWTEPVEDIVYRSMSLVSNDVVAVNTSVCRKCRLVHKYIVRGSRLAEKKNLNVEGYYISGAPISYFPCTVSDNAAGYSAVVNARDR